MPSQRAFFRYTLTEGLLRRCFPQPSLFDPPRGSATQPRASSETRSDLKSRSCSGTRTSRLVLPLHICNSLGRYRTHKDVLRKIGKDDRQRIEELLETGLLVDRQQVQIAKSPCILARAAVLL